MNVETIIAVFIAVFGSGAGASFIRWIGDRKKRDLSDSEARIAQATTITKTAMEMTETQASQIQRLADRLEDLETDLQRVRDENTMLRNRITHLEQSLAVWRAAWRQHLPDEPYPVN